MKANLLLLTLLLCHYTYAQTPSWKVQPSICIAQNIGDTCQLEVIISPQNLEPGVYCLFINEQKKICSQQGGLPKKIAIAYSENTALTLKNKAGDNVLSHHLQIKYLNAEKRRRRIRNPWSIF